MMKTGLITLALAAVIAAPASAQTAGTTGTTGTTSTADTSKKATPQTTMGAVKVKNKVSDSLAAAVKVGADSALALARIAADSGEVSSVDLEMKDGHLVYEVKVLNKNKGAAEVQIDAMTGEIMKDKKYGGVKAPVVHHQENKKLLDAKKDSARTTAPVTTSVPKTNP